MKTLALLLALTLTSCVVTPRHRPAPVTPRDWSEFVQPPAGVPCMMRAFYLIDAAGRWDTVDFSGTWGDGEPFLVSFPVWKTLNNVVRIEIHFRGEVMAARNFEPPTTFTGGTTAGWTK